MQLSELRAALPAVLGWVGADVEVHGISADSRRLEPGDLFVAIPGVNVDGHRFIPQALETGAAAVVGERSAESLPDLPACVAYVQVPDAREAWAWLCAAWRDFPSRKMMLIGVTGTDGKTTTVNIIYAMLRAAGLGAGMVSTVNVRILAKGPLASAGRRGEDEDDTGLHTTTPDPPEVQQYLARMVEAGVTHGVLEVTSHGLAQHRVTGCDFDVAAVTNVTHEHLDFHGSLKAYQQAKARLFEGLMNSFRKTGVPKVAVLNRDDDSYRYLSRIPADRQVVYSVSHSADVVAREVQLKPDATRFMLGLPDGELLVDTALVGMHNVSNVLAAAAVGVALNLSREAIVRGVEAMRSVPGRMERIDEGQDFLAIVDFAHTPNALAQALKTARGMTDGKVIVVFGCAGLRDVEKRTMMGRIAGELADVVVLTAEDPRTENLDDIMAASAVAAQKAGKREGVDLFRVADRGEAILWACQMAEQGDLVIACGKGHEQSMCFGTTEYPWDDREAMRLALRGEALDTLPTANTKQQTE